MLAGGGLPSGLIGSALVLGLLGFTWWAGGVLDAADEALFGDQPAVPDEMRGEAPGGKSLGRGGRDHAGHLESLAHTHKQQNKSSVALVGRERK